MPIGIEPDIRINGTRLTVAQAMTVRVALGAFGITLSDPEGLGDDETGIALCQGYKKAIAEVHKLMLL